MNNLGLSINPNQENFQQIFGSLLSEFDASMGALQMQDLPKSENALQKAKNHQRLAIKGGHEDARDLLQIFVNCMEVSSKILKSNFLSVEGNPGRSLELLKEASEISKNAYELNENLTTQLIDPADLSRYNETFYILFDFYNSVIDATLITTEGAFRKEQHKFLNEVEMYRAAAKRLRHTDMLTVSSESSETYVGFLSLLKMYAESYDKKADMLEEKQKYIQFMDPIGTDIFIVHGQDRSNLLELKNMLQTKFNINPIILSEMPDQGNTVIEKFENYARHCAFALVVITADDLVESKKGDYYQGRPNVLFELGWFCGRFGRDKVRILLQRKTRLPSDLNGILTINFDDNITETYEKLDTELKHLGLVQEY